MSTFTAEKLGFMIRWHNAKASKLVELSKLAKDTDLRSKLIADAEAHLQTSEALLLLIDHIAADEQAAATMAMFERAMDGGATH